jgi:hypothetical protein
MNGSDTPRHFSCLLLVLELEAAGNEGTSLELIPTNLGLLQQEAMGLNTESSTALSQDPRNPIALRNDCSFFEPVGRHGHYSVGTQLLTAILSLFSRSYKQSLR